MNDRYVIAQPAEDVEFERGDDGRKGLALQSRSRNQWAWLILALVILSLSVVLRVRDGRTVAVPGVGELPEICTFKRLTGIGCAGCGLTRCFISAARGDFRSAWRYNPLGIAVFLAVAVQVPYRSYLIWRIRRGDPPRTDGGRTAAWLLVVMAMLLVVQWLARMAMGVA